MIAVFFLVNGLAALVGLVVFPIYRDKERECLNSSPDQTSVMAQIPVQRNLHGVSCRVP